MHVPVDCKRLHCPQELVTPLQPNATDHIELIGGIRAAYIFKAMLASVFRAVLSCLQGVGTSRSSSPCWSAPAAGLQSDCSGARDGSCSEHSLAPCRVLEHQAPGSAAERLRFLGLLRCILPGLCTCPVIAPSGCCLPSRLTAAAAAFADVLTAYAASVV